MPGELAVLDTRLVADLTLELSFVLTTKTLLSEQHSLDELPLRFDVIFEDYMRLAGLVLALPPLDFAKCSYNLRSFAKRMERNGFISMDAGLNVKEVHHSIIDDLYPDATIFAGGAVVDEQDEDILDGLLDPSDLEAVDSGDEVTTSLLLGFGSAADGTAAAGDELCAPAFCKGEDTSARLVRENKKKLTRKMSLLRVLHARQEQKQIWLEQKQQKQTRKMLEKELRQMNVRSRGEHARGQGHRDGKYEMIMSEDSQARAFHQKHTHSLRAAEMMVAIKTNCERLQKQLRDVSSSDIQRIVGTAAQHQQQVQQEAKPTTGATPAPCIVADFARPDEEPCRAGDDRGEQKHLHKGLDSRAPASASGTALGANLKVVREVRKLLVALGFSGSRDLVELPSYSELRSAYKRALLTVHPDKKPGSAGEFEQLQKGYQDLLARYYDSDLQNFSAEVKAHRKAHVEVKTRRVVHAGKATKDVSAEETAHRKAHAAKAVQDTRVKIRKEAAGGKTRKEG